MKHRLALALVLAAGCAPYLDVETDWNPSYVARMDDYRTFAWLETDDGELPYESMEEERIQEAIARHLTRRGYRQAAPGQPADFLVAWYYTVEDRVRVSHYDWYGPYWYDSYYGADTWVDQWQEGVLVVDVVDGRDGELAWRGVAASEVVDYDDPGERIGRIRKVVDEVLSGFPPPASAPPRVGRPAPQARPTVAQGR